MEPVYDGLMIGSGRSFALFAVLCIAVIAVVFQSHAPSQESQPAVALGAVVPPQFTADIAPMETVFPVAQDIDWQGRIFAVLSGGRGVAVQRTDGGQLFQAYFSDDNRASVSYGAVRVRGRLTGISCAYAQTIFSGRCTPSVDIVEMSVLP